MSRRGLTALLLIAMCGGYAAAAEPPQDPAKQTDALVAVLKSDAPLEQKFEACRRLAAVGDARAVPVLAGLLPDAKLSHIARHALEPIPGDVVDAALRNALATLQGDLRIGVIHSLGVRRDPKAVPALAPLLGDTDPRTVAAAALSLGRIATPEAARALAGLRAKPPATLQDAAADGSLALARRLIELDRAAEAAPVCVELQESRWPRHVRLGAFVALLAAEPAKAPARIIEAVAGKDAQMRAAAIAQIPTLQGKDVAAQFASELPKMPLDAQVLLIGALSALPDAATGLRPVATAAIGSASEAVRAAALRALGNVGDAGSVVFLCAVLVKGKTDTDRQTAAASLRAIQAQGADKAILACLTEKETPDAARAELVAILADRKAVAAVPELLKQATAQDNALRSAAWKALGHLAEPKDMLPLISALARLAGDDGRRDAERAVAQVARKSAHNPARPVLSALMDTSATPTYISLLRVLGGIADGPSLEAVRASVKSGDPAQRDAAIRILADWPDDGPLPTLLHLFRTTDNPTHRVLALRGSVRLLGLGSRPAAEALKTYADLAAAAERVEDRKLVLSGLATVPDPAAIKAIEPFLADPATAAEAELALAKVAQSLIGTAPSDARAVAERLQKDAKSPAVKKQAAQILRNAGRFADYIVAWQAVGPYVEEGKDGSQLVDVVFQPEKPDARDVAWRMLPVNLASKQPWMLELDRIMPGQDRVGYVRTWVAAPKAQPVLLEFGTDDGNKVWLNGAVVHVNGVGGAAIPGEHKVKAQLKEGWNAVLLKVTQQTGPWQFCFRIRSAGGGKQEGLRVQATPPAQ
jgi:HEAT repeat protein